MYYYQHFTVKETKRQRLEYLLKVTQLEVRGRIYTQKVWCQSMCS